MYACVSWNGFSLETQKLIRILLIASILTVGSLQVTKCSTDTDGVDSRHDLYDQVER